jgi:hypothetical protein
VNRLTFTFAKDLAIDIIDDLDVYALCHIFLSGRESIVQ